MCVFVCVKSALPDTCTEIHSDTTDAMLATALGDARFGSPMAPTTTVAIPTSPRPTTASVCAPLLIDNYNLFSSNANVFGGYVSDDNTMASIACISRSTKAVDPIASTLLFAGFQPVGSVSVVAVVSVQA